MFEVDKHLLNSDIDVNQKKASVRLGKASKSNKGKKEEKTDRQRNKGINSDEYRKIKLNTIKRIWKKDEIIT